MDEASVSRSIYNLNIAVFLILVILLTLVLFFTLPYSGGDLAIMVFFTVLILFCVLAVIVLHIMKKRRVKYLTEVPREVRDKKEIKNNTKFLIGGFVVMVAILGIVMLTSPLEYAPGMLIAMFVFFLIAFGFYKYNLQQE